MHEDCETVCVTAAEKFEWVAQGDESVKEKAREHGHVVVLMV